MGSKGSPLAGSLRLPDKCESIFGSPHPPVCAESSQDLQSPEPASRDNLYAVRNELSGVTIFTFRELMVLETPVRGREKRSYTGMMAPRSRRKRSLNYWQICQNSFRISGTPVGTPPRGSAPLDPRQGRSPWNSSLGVVGREGGRRPDGLPSDR